MRIVLNTDTLKKDVEELKKIKTCYSTGGSSFLSSSNNPILLANYIKNIRQIYNDITWNINELTEYLSDYISDMEALDNKMNGSSGSIKASNGNSIANAYKNIIEQLQIEDTEILGINKYTPGENDLQIVDPEYVDVNLPATLAICGLSFLEGLANVGENIMDGGAMLIAGGASLLGYDDVANDIGEFVKRDISKELYYNVVSETGLDEYADPDSTAAQIFSTAGNIVGMVGISIATGGLVSSTFGAGTTAAKVAGGIANGLIGASVDAGSEAESALQRGATIEEAELVGLEAAGYGFAKGAVTGRLDQAARSGVGLGKITKYAFASFAVGASEPLVNEMAHTVIYDHDDSKSLVENFTENAKEYNLPFQMLMAGGMASLGTIGNGISANRSIKSTLKTMDVEKVDTKNLKQLDKIEIKQKSTELNKLIAQNPDLSKKLNLSKIDESLTKADLEKILKMRTLKWEIENKAVPTNKFTIEHFSYYDKVAEAKTKLEKISPKLTQFYEDGKISGRTLEFFLGFEEHNFLHVSRVAEESVDVMKEIRKLNLEELGDIDDRTLYLAGLAHDLGMREGLYSFDKETDVMSKIIDDYGTEVRGGHPSGSAITVVQNRDIFGDDTEKIAVLTLLHSKSTSQVSDLMDDEQLSDALRKLYLNQVYDGEKLYDFDISKFVEVDENGKPITYMGKRTVDKGKKTEHIIDMEKYILKEDAAKELKAGAIALRIGDAHANKTGFNHGGGKITINEFASKKVAQEFLDKDEFMFYPKINDISDLEALEGKINIEYIDETIHLGETSSTRFSMKIIMGERNERTLKSIVDGDTLVHRMQVLSEDAPASTWLYGIEEKFGEYKTFKNVKQRVEIEVPENVAKMYEIAAEGYMDKNPWLDIVIKRAKSTENINKTVDINNKFMSTFNDPYATVTITEKLTQPPQNIVENNVITMVTDSIKKQTIKDIVVSFINGKVFALHKNKLLKKFDKVMPVTKANKETQRMIRDSFDKEISKGNSDAYAILASFIKLKKNDPYIDIVVDPNCDRSCFRSQDNKVHLELADAHNKGVLFHEMGHMIWMNKLNYLPDYYDEIVKKAKDLASNGEYLNSDIKLFRNIENTAINQAYKNFETRLKNFENISVEEYINQIANYYDNVLSNLSQADYGEFRTKLKQEGLNDRTIDEIMYGRITSKDLAISDFNELVRKEGVEIEETEYFNYTQLSDMIDAVFEGEKQDTREIRWGHGSKYYKSDPYKPFNEMMAQYTALKATGDENMINKIRNTFGEDFYNMLNTTFYQMTNY